MSDNTQNTVEIFSNQAYALPGEAILQILNVLREEIPVKNASTVLKVENLLATVIPVRLSESLAPEGLSAEMPTVPEGTDNGATGAPDQE
jgi:hypothetical protein